MDFQLQLRAIALRDLCYLWQTQLRPIPPAYPMSESWGPSDQDLQEAAGDATHGSWIEDDDLGVDPEPYHSHEEDEDEAESEIDDDLDMELIDEIENMLWRDAYHNDHSDEFPDDYSPVSVASSTSSHKRPRTMYE